MRITKGQLRRIIREITNPVQTSKMPHTLEVGDEVDIGEADSRGSWTEPGVVVELIGDEQVRVEFDDSPGQTEVVNADIVYPRETR